MELNFRVTLTCGTADSTALMTALLNRLATLPASICPDLQAIGIDNLNGCTVTATGQHFAQRQWQGEDLQGDARRLAVTTQQIERLQAGLEAFEREPLSASVHPKLWGACRDGMAAKLDELKQQAAAYETAVYG